MFTAITVFIRENFIAYTWQTQNRLGNNRCAASHYGTVFYSGVREALEIMTNDL